MREQDSERKKPRSMEERDPGAVFLQRRGHFGACTFRLHGVWPLKGSLQKSLSGAAQMRYGLQVKGLGEEIGQRQSLDAVATIDKHA